MVYYFPIINIPSQRNFEEILIEALDKSRRNQQIVCLMFLELDGYRFVHDTLGQAIGEQLLQEIENKIAECIGVHNHVARLGEAIFAIMLSKINGRASIEPIAQEITGMFEDSVALDTYEFYISSFLGINIYPEGGEDVQSLIEHAGLAVSHAKEQGRHQYHLYTPTIDVKTYKNYTLKNDLRKALRQGEFVLHYQPRVQVLTQKITGAEALIRWNHPVWGYIPPNEFISIAEETGLIVPIGDWVLRSVCLQNKMWQDRGLPQIKVSINFSSLQFLQERVVEKIVQTLEEFQLEPRCLEIEITEKTYSENKEEMITILNQLKELGVQIAYDDFGSGYTTLASIQNLNIDSIMIHNSYMKEIPKDPETKEIVAELIKLAHHHQLNVVAEGVETLEQLAFLDEIQCDEVQGYVFSKAVSVEAFEDLLIKGSILPQLSPHQAASLEKNRRQYVRIELDAPILADMTIIRMGTQPVALGSNPVLIEDISSGGFRFLSNIKLPSNTEMLLGFHTEILDKSVHMFGNVVWIMEVEEGIYRYGLEFAFDETVRETITNLLKQLCMYHGIQNRYQYRSIKEDKLDFLKAIVQR